MNLQLIERPKQLEELYLPLNSSIGAVVVALSGLGSLVSFVLLIIAFIHRQKKLIKTFGLVFIFPMIFGSLLMFISLFFLVGRPSAVLCSLNPILFSIGTVIFLSSINLKVILNRL